MRTEGRTDMTKLIFAFRTFANAPKIDVCHVKQGPYKNLYNANTRCGFYKVFIPVYLWFI
jgi:hypothetical protein